MLGGRDPYRHLDDCRGGSVTAPYPNFDGSQICAQTDPEMFFMDHQGANPRPAKKLCADCPFLEECREYAVWHNVVGVWGGTTERARQAIRTQRGIKMVSAESGARLRDLILAASPVMLASSLAEQLGCSEKSVQRHRNAARQAEEAA